MISLNNILFDVNSFFFILNGVICSKHPLEVVVASLDIKSVKIRESMVGIRSFAFNGCSLIRSITIPSSVKRIGSYVSQRSYKLEKLRFKKNSQLTSIGKYAFQLTNLRKIHFPSSLRSIGFKAFEINQSASVIFDEDSQLRYVGFHAFKKQYSVKGPIRIQKMIKYSFKFSQ